MRQINQPAGRIFRTCENLLRRQFTVQRTQKRKKIIPRPIRFRERTAALPEQFLIAAERPWRKHERQCIEPAVVRTELFNLRIEKITPVGKFRLKEFRKIKVFLLLGNRFA